MRSTSITITEEQARQIAQQFVADNSLEKCTIEAVLQLSRSENDDPKIGECVDWVVHFRSICDDEDEMPYWYIVVIDDKTGEPRFFETL